MNILEGYKLAEKKPNQKMIAAGLLMCIGASEVDASLIEAIYSVMLSLSDDPELAAAPTPSVQDDEESPYIKIFANANGEPTGYDTNIEHDDTFERLASVVRHSVWHLSVDWRE